MNKILMGMILMPGLLISTAGAVNVNVGESWSGSNTAGWVGYDLISEVPIASTALSGSFQIKFPSYLPLTNPVTHAVSIPMVMPPEKYLIKAGQSASGGIFTGDYMSNGVAAVSFRFWCDYPVQAWLAFQNESAGRWWQLNLGVQPTGGWNTVTAPIQPLVFKELMGAKDWASFQQDVKHVSWIGIVVLRNSSINPQTVLVDDFTLTGPGADFASWMAQFTNQVTMNNTQNSLPDADLDGDGQNNTAEWIAGTSAADSNDCFRLTIEQGGANGPRLRWKSKAGRVYSVWKSTNLSAGFSQIGGDMAPTADDATYEETNAPGSAFYRVNVRMAQ